MTDVPATLPTKDQFFSELNSQFRARLGDGPAFDLTLVDSHVQLSTASQECFTLLFRAPLDSEPVQSIYRLDHENLGTMEIFLVPVKKDDEGLYYEAVFNKMLSAQAK
ncbi:MAG: hypothetical protein ABI999_07300 [Acidobacteriota bacterium]